MEVGAGSFELHLKLQSASQEVSYLIKMGFPLRISGQLKWLCITICVEMAIILCNILTEKVNFACH